MGSITKIESVQINTKLIEMLEELLDLAKEGKLKTFVGTGLLADNKVITMKSVSDNSNMFTLLGAVTNLSYYVTDMIE